MAKRLSWTVRFEVDESWVADGFVLTKERALDMLQREIPYAYEKELKVRIVAKPLDAEIAKAQGYPSVKAYRDSFK